MKPLLKKFKGLTVGVTLIVSLTGCAVTTPPLTEEQRLARVSVDLERLFANQAAVNGPITLSEAMARAIKYNMDHRVKLMEYAVANRHVEVARMELLPDLVLSAGYTDRSNDPGATSVSLLTGQISLEPSTSQERQRDLADAVFYWNLLDFGVGYVTAKQRYDEVYIAGERRRKVVQNIIHDVIEAYWRAWSAQNLVGQMEMLIEETDQVIEDSKRLVELGSQPKEQALEYQQALMEIRTQLWEMRERMALSQTRLATLINLRPGTEYTLDVPRVEDLPPLFQKTLEGLEQEALLNRPELREEDYRLRVSQGEVKKAMLRMFPGLEITAGGHYDSNLFLFNQSWADGLVQVSWNIFNVLRGMEGKKFREAQVTLADTRRMALTMAVMTQVRLAAQRYDLARARYRSLNELSEVNMALLELAEGSTTTTTKFERIRAQAVSAASTMRSNLAYAEVQAAFSRVLNSIGVDPMPEEVASHELGLLTEAIDDHWNKILDQRLDGAKIAVLDSEKLQSDLKVAMGRVSGPHPQSHPQSPPPNKSVDAEQTGIAEQAKKLPSSFVHKDNTAETTQFISTGKSGIAEQMMTRPSASTRKANTATRTSVFATGKSAFAENVTAQRPSSAKNGKVRTTLAVSAATTPTQVPWQLQSQPPSRKQSVDSSQSNIAAQVTTRPSSLTFEAGPAKRTAGKPGMAEKVTAKPLSSAGKANTAKVTSVAATGRSDMAKIVPAKPSSSARKASPAKRASIVATGKSAFAEDVIAQRSSPAKKDGTVRTTPAVSTTPTSTQVPWRSQSQPQVQRESIAIGKPASAEKAGAQPLSSALETNTAKRAPLIVTGKSVSVKKVTAQPSASALGAIAAKRTPIVAAGKSASAEKVAVQPSPSATAADMAKKSTIAVSGKSAFADNVTTRRSASAQPGGKVRTTPPVSTAPIPAQVPWRSQALPVTQIESVEPGQAGITATVTIQPSASSRSANTAKRVPSRANGKSDMADKVTTQPSASARKASPAKRASIVATGKSTFAEDVTAQRSSSAKNGTVRTTQPVSAVPTPAQVPWLPQTLPVTQIESVEPGQAGITATVTTQPSASSRSANTAKRVPSIANGKSDMAYKVTTQTSSAAVEVTTAKRAPIVATRKSASAKSLMAQPLSLTPEPSVVKKMPVISAVSTRQRVPWE